MRTTVAIVQSGEEAGDVEAATRRVIDFAGGLSGLISPGQRVLVKPNMVAPVPSAVTDPRVLSEVVRSLLDLGAKVTIGGCPGFEYDSATTIMILGVKQLAETLGVGFVNFEEEDYVRVPFPHPMVKSVGVARAAVECDAIVNLPRMKCHKLTDVSLAIKNLFGVIEKKRRREVHAKGLHRGIAALNEVFKPVMTVMDGLIVPAAGAVYGPSLKLNILAASTDMLALDLTMSRILSFDPSKVGHLAIAVRRSGVPDIDVIGDPVQPVKVSKRGRRWRRKLYRDMFQGIYGLDHYLSLLGYKSIIPWFHTTFGIRPVFDWSKCNQCSYCAQACPVDAIDLSNHRIDYGACGKARCLECVNVCAQGAVCVKQTFKS